MDDTPSPPDAESPPPTGAAGPAPDAPAAPATPWEGPAPDAVAWLLVNWHNKHPLARRISLHDVHTVGAVALPFLAQPLPKEPSLDGASTDTPPTPPAKRRWPWQRRGAGNGPRRAWSEDFIPGLKPDAVAALALDHGFTGGPDELPLRRVDISNSELESGGANQSGAWPMELVLLSAAIDAGPARRRVLIGRRDQVLGKRAMDPIRLGAVAAVGVVLLALLIWLLWPASPKAPEGGPDAAAGAAGAASAASAASAARVAEATSAPSAASEPASAASATAQAGSDAASAPEAAASAASAAASAASQAALAASGTIDLPLTAAKRNNGRPSLQSGVERMREEQTAQKEAPKEGQKDGQKAAAGGAASSAASAPTEAEQRLNVDDAGLGQMIKRGAGGKLVALVSLPQKTKPEAEAQLAKMKDMIGQTLRGSGTAVNGEVFQTKEGWRAAVWPFGSREEAQLINATLLARGMRARAIDF